MSGSRRAQQTTSTTLKNTQVRPEGGWPGGPPWDARGTRIEGVLGASRFCRDETEVARLAPARAGRLWTWEQHVCNCRLVWFRMLVGGERSRSTLLEEATVRALLLWNKQEARPPEHAPSERRQAGFQFRCLTGSSLESWDSTVNNTIFLD